MLISHLLLKFLNLTVDVMSDQNSQKFETINDIFSDVHNHILIFIME